MADYYDNGISSDIDGAKYNRMYVDLIPSLIRQKKMLNFCIILFCQIFQWWCSANYKTNEDFTPIHIKSVSKLAEYFKSDRKTIRKALEDMESAKLINISKKGRKLSIQCNKEIIFTMISKYTKMGNESPLTG